MVNANKSLTATYVPDATDSCSTANASPKDTWISERSSGNNDVDWFEFHIGKKQKITIRVADQPISLKARALQGLLDPTGQRQRTRPQRRRDHPQAGPGDLSGPDHVAEQQLERRAPTGSASCAGSPASRSSAGQHLAEGEQHVGGALGEPAHVPAGTTRRRRR